jgi:hypothetical protein
MGNAKKPELRTAQITTPSKAERANGWDEAALAEHLEQVAQREHAELMHRLFPEKPALRVENVASFDPHHW